MDTARQQLSIGLIGVLLGGLIGAILGVAVGTTADSTATQTQIETVVRTQNLVKTRVLGGPTSSTNTNTNTSTGPVDTVPPIVAPPPTTATVPAYTVPPTATTPSGADQNDIQPVDPANPPANFCLAHVCGPTYAQGDGPAVECADGVWTREGGAAVTCSADGGLGKQSGGA
ncbi:MAG TPA: hypothetical protein VHW26_02230 [Solirubrobacteraceae bacterium]|nr:hypothetical protein [Solirubrobacteraceae bacterium]